MEELSYGEADFLQTSAQAISSRKKISSHPAADSCAHTFPTQPSTNGDTPVFAQSQLSPNPTSFKALDSSDDKLDNKLLGPDPTGINREL